MRRSAERKFQSVDSQIQISQIQRKMIGQVMQLRLLVHPVREAGAFVGALLQIAPAWWR